MPTHYDHLRYSADTDINAKPARVVSIGSAGICLPDDCLLKDYDVPLPWKDHTPEAALKSSLAL